VLLRVGRWGSRKKLADAARHWAAGGALPDDGEQALDDLRAFGVTDAQAVEIVDPSVEADAFEVWPENARSVEIFTYYCATQWRVVAGMSVVTLGLDYAAIWSTLRGLRIRNARAVFEDIVVMERAATTVLNQKQSSGRNAWRSISQQPSR